MGARGAAYEGRREAPRQPDEEEAEDEVEDGRLVVRHGGDGERRESGGWRASESLAEPWDLALANPPPHLARCRRIYQGVLGGARSSACTPSNRPMSSPG